MREFFRGKSKSTKPLDSNCRTGPNSGVEFPQTQQNVMYNHYPPPQSHLNPPPNQQPQIQIHHHQQQQQQQHTTLHQPPFQPPTMCHQTHQPMAPIVSPNCIHAPCMSPPQQPFLQIQQSLPYTTYRNNNLDLRTESAVVGNQIQFHQPNSMPSMPVYASNNVQSATMTNQSPLRCTDNMYYNYTQPPMSNVHHHQQQQQQTQLQNNQISQYQQQQQFQNNQQLHTQQQQQQQFHSQQHQQQQQQLQFEEPRHKYQPQSEQSHHQQQQQTQLHQIQQQQQQQQQHFEAQRQQQQQVQMRLQQQQETQQQYQNHQQVENEAYYDNEVGDLSLEAKCLMHESSNKELSKLANSLRVDFENLSAKLELIRKKLPDYSVDEVRI